MGNQNGIITWPVNPETDVYRVLGIGPTENGYEVNYACSNKHGKINMWSRRKPVHYQNALEPDRTTQWWKGSQGKCGLNVPSTNYIGSLPSLFTADRKNGWSYEPPRGGLASPYRIADFDGYMHDAQPPISSWDIDSRVYPGKSLTVQKTESLPSADKTGPGSIGLDDITVATETGDITMDKLFFGVVITDADGNVKGRVATGATISYDTTNLAYGEYYCYPFLCINSIGQSENDKANVFYPLPDLSRKAFQVVSAEDYYGINIFLTASIQDGTLLRFTAQVSSIAKVKFTNVWIRVRFQTSNSNTPQQVGEIYQKMDDFTTENNQSDPTEISYINRDLDKTKNYRIWFSCQTDVMGLIEKYIDPMIEFLPIL